MLNGAWEVVRTVELEPISFESGDSLLFRIELQRRLAAPHELRAKVWRVEAFQMRPAWPDGSRESTDSLLVSDDSYTGEIRGTDEQEVLARVLAELERQFGRHA